MTDYCKKFYEVLEEKSPEQTKYVEDLFKAVEAAGTKLPQEFLAKIEEAKSAAASAPAATAN